MRLLFGIISLVVLAGCDQPLASTTEKPSMITTPSHEVMIAYQYINYNETTHRQELKEVLGVDPVRTEWCAAFVNAVLRDSGVDGSESVSSYPLTARSFIEWGKPVEEPQSGDVVVFPRGNVAWQGHVGFYLRTITLDGVDYYYILGGNQDNSVSIELYRADRAIAIRRQSAV